MEEGALNLGSYEKGKWTTLIITTGEPAIVLADKDGKVIWSAP